MAKKQTGWAYLTLTIPKEQSEWLENRPNGQSKALTIRQLIANAMETEQKLKEKL